LFAGQDRAAMRAAWRTAWQRHLERLPLAPLQAQMTDVMAAHPEFHAKLIENQTPEADSAEDSAATGRAFLHLALHLALREQLSTDRPLGIAQLHRQLAAACHEGHAAEHRMISVLGQMLWEAQRTGSMPDESQYLEALQRL
jgi:hypothetical protein